MFVKKFLHNLFSTNFARDNIFDSWGSFMIDLYMFPDLPREHKFFITQGASSLLWSVISLNMDFKILYPVVTQFTFLWLPMLCNPMFLQFSFTIYNNFAYRTLVSFLRSASWSCFSEQSIFYLCLYMSPFRNKIRVLLLILKL